MKEIKNIKSSKIIIGIISLIFLLQIAGDFLIKDSYAENVEELVKALTFKGYMISEIREIKRPEQVRISSIPGIEKEIAISNLYVNIMIFGDSETAKNALNDISKDGNRIGHRYIFRIHRPHIYQSGEMIVTYVGNNLKMQWNLRNILGRQVRGSKWWEEPLNPIVTKLYQIINY